MAQAVASEVGALLSRHADKLTDDGRALLVRQGYPISASKLENELGGERPRHSKVGSPRRFGGIWKIARGGRPFSIAATRRSGSDCKPDFAPYGYSSSRRSQTINRSATLIAKILHGDSVSGLGLHLGASRHSSIGTRLTRAAASDFQ